MMKPRIDEFNEDLKALFSKYRVEYIVKNDQLYVYLPLIRDEATSEILEDSIEINFGYWGNQSPLIKDSNGLIIQKISPAINYHLDVLLAGNTFDGWDSNANGQPGDETTINRSSPVQVGALTTWKAVASGSNHTIATKTDGTLWAWGSNANGQLGDGTTTDRSSPVQVGALTTWEAITGGNYHSIATKTDGTLWAWGLNSSGQLGDGTTVYRSSPVQVGALTTWKAIAGGNSHTVATKTDGTIWAWGYNSNGQHWNDEMAVYSSSPVQMSDPNIWKTAINENSYEVIVKTDGTLWAWGHNNFGQLGDGTTTDKSSPVQVGTLTTWSAVAIGNNHTIAINTDGTLWAWGYNANGQLGDGTTTDRSAAV